MRERQGKNEIKACSMLGLKRKREREASQLVTISSNKTQAEEAKHEEAQEKSLSLAYISSSPVVNNQKKVFFFLDNAAIGKIQTRKGKLKVAHSMDDAEAIQRQKKNVDHYRSDILHEALRAIFDSPLCKYGMVGGIYVKIEKGVLFEIKPHVRIMRTLPRFCGVMLDLLNKSSVRTKETNEKLFHVIEEPVTRHLPPNSRIIGISTDCQKVVDIEDYVSAANDDRNLVFVVGASVHGKIGEQHVDDLISVSNYPMVPRWRIELICEAFEKKWNIF